MRWQRLYNPFVVALLRSPLHGFMSGFTMLHLCGVQEWQGIHHAGNYLGDGDASLGSVGSILSFGSILKYRKRRLNPVHRKRWFTPQHRQFGFDSQHRQRGQHLEHR